MEDLNGCHQKTTASSKQKLFDFNKTSGSPFEDGHNTDQFSSVSRNASFSSKEHNAFNDNQVNSPKEKNSQCHTSRKDKIFGQEIPLEETPLKSEAIFSDEEEHETSSNDGKKFSWFPNPAKYNIDGFDIDSRFFEEVCKQRESEDCWDTYMKLLNDKSQDDGDSEDVEDSDVSDIIDNNVDNINGDDDNDDYVLNIGSNNDFSVGDDNHLPSYSGTYERTDKLVEEMDEEKKSRVDSNSFFNSSYKENKTGGSSGNSFSSSKSLNEEVPKQEEKERLYFLNGMGYYGIPPTTSAGETTKSKPKMDPSENEFYRNLRFYFNVKDTKPTATAAASKKDSSPTSLGSKKPHFTASETSHSSSAKNKEKEYVLPSKDTFTTESGRSTSPADEEKLHMRSNTHKSRTFCAQPQDEKDSKEGLHSNVKKDSVKGADKAQLPKKGTFSDRKGKKAYKKKSTSQEDSIPQQTTAGTKLSKKHKQKNPESAKENEQIPGHKRTNRMTKEEMTKKTSNSNKMNELKEGTFWQSCKKYCTAFLWILYYALLVLVFTLVFAALGLFYIVKFLVKLIMSFRISIAVKNKLVLWKAKLISYGLGLTVWLIGLYYSWKSRCIRWYFGIRTLGVRKFFFGSNRPAKTYNLPNTGEDAVQQLLLKKNSDPYSILGVPNEASNEDIRKQYKKLAVLVHPDKNSDVRAPEAFRILSGAYDIIGDPEKRTEFDLEGARKQTSHSSGSPPRNFTDPMDVIDEFLRQMKEMRESLSCDVCERRHRRILTDRNVMNARRCYRCNTMHQAKEGDFWKESTYMGLGRAKYYTRMEGQIYDISEWGHCQERNGFNLPSDTHRVLGRISTRSRYRTSRIEEDFWREFFGPNDQYGGSHDNQGNRNRQQRSRRRKRR